MCMYTYSFLYRLGEGCSHFWVHYKKWLHCIYIQSLRLEWSVLNKADNCLCRIDFLSLLLQHEPAQIFELDFSELKIAGSRPLSETKQMISTLAQFLLQRCQVLSRKEHFMCGLHRLYPKEQLLWISSLKMKFKSVNRQLKCLPVWSHPTITHSIVH